MSGKNKMKGLPNGGQTKDGKGAESAPKEDRVRDKATIRNVAMEKKRREQGHERVRELLAATNGEFPKEERDLIQYYYFDDRSQEETAALLSVSPERFWKIHDSATKKIRKFLPNTELF